RRSLPAIDGTATIAGISAPIEIIRDADAIPHVFAASKLDGLFGLGYVHAQDRLWQMEFQRRIANGRLSELRGVGERLFETDRFIRTLGLAQVAERTISHSDAETLASLKAYAAGVNAFIDSGAVLPIEFHIFGVEPEPWKPADTLAWLGVMALDLSGNYRTELTRVRFAAKIGRERVNEIIPPYPGDSAAPLPDFKQLYAEVDPTAKALLAATPNHEQSVGSNNWVVDGTRSETGKPLLANDPHLGLQAPALWYLVHLSTPGGNVVGGTMPGVPFVVLGRNDNLAWGFTTTTSDTQDLFVERVAPGDAASYMTPKGAVKFEVREEVIRVGAEERRITVRSTRHGPVISDAMKIAAQAAPKGYVLALAWPALSEDNGVARAGFALNRARTRGELVAALKDFDAPQQNVVYADREGHIGFIAPALVPVRRADNEAMGRVPVPGWDPKYDWQGFIPYDKLPAIQDPPSHHIVTANNKITPPGYKPFISYDWFPPYRADRIEAMLAATPKHSLDSFARIQADVQSASAREMLAVALAAKPGTDPGREAQAMLKGWKGAMTVDDAAPLVYAAWYRELTRLVYADELGDLFKDSWEQRLQFMASVMKGERGLDRWCDDVTTPARETCAQRSALAFDRAAEDLGKRYGRASGWRWGLAHPAAGDHRPLGRFPVIGSLFNVDPETPGDSFTVDVGHYFVGDDERPFANRHAASLRALYDLADLDRSRFMQSTGQSGNILSPWYSNFAERWARVEYVTIPARREAIAVEHRLVLNP
ncbi:MAG TPA: penicillin acylase family protein, partial [Usitatibacter sp.]